MLAMSSPLIKAIRSTWRTLLQGTSHLRLGASGVGLVETAISLAIVGIVVPTIVGGVAGAVVGVDTSNNRTNVDFFLKSQLDFVATQGFRDDGQYQLLTNLPEGFELKLQVKTIRPGILQEITALANRAGAPPTTLATYHTNRLLETGMRPPAAGLEATHPIAFPLTLSPGQGVFQVVNVLPTKYHGQLRGRWELVPTRDNKGVVEVSKSVRALSVTVFQGTPFGPGPQNTSLLPPELVNGTILSSGEPTPKEKAQALFQEAFMLNALPGAYTLYFFNRDSKAATTQRVTVTCVCLE